MRIADMLRTQFFGGRRYGRQVQQDAFHQYDQALRYQQTVYYDAQRLMLYMQGAQTEMYGQQVAFFQGSQWVSTPPDYLKDPMDPDLVMDEGL